MAKHLSTSELSTLLTNTAGITVGTEKTITGVAEAASVVTVTCASHGLAALDKVAIYNVGGAVEANGVFIVAAVPLSSTFTLTGLTAVTTYTSGGKFKKLTPTSTGGLTGGLTPGDLDDLQDALKRVYHVKGTDADRSAEVAISTTLATAG